MLENLQIQEVQSSTVGNFKIVVTGGCKISNDDLVPWVKLIVRKIGEFAEEEEWEEEEWEEEWEEGSGEFAEEEEGGRWEILAYNYGVFNLKCYPEVIILPSPSGVGNLSPKVDELLSDIYDDVGDVLESSGFVYVWEEEGYVYDGGVDDSVEEVEDVVVATVVNVLNYIEEELSRGEKWREIEVSLKVSVKLKFVVERESFDEVTGDDPLVLLVKEKVKMGKILREEGWNLGQAMKISEVYDKLVTLLRLACDFEDAETNQGYEDLLNILQEYMERDGEVVIEIE
ncbi:MAG: hypothetical protein QW815_00020 [Nitrososphaerota archaeon]